MLTSDAYMGSILGLIIGLSVNLVGSLPNNHNGSSISGTRSLEKLTWLEEDLKQTTVEANRLKRDLAELLDIRETINTLLNHRIIRYDTLVQALKKPNDPENAGLLEAVKNVSTANIPDLERLILRIRMSLNNDDRNKLAAVELYFGKIKVRMKELIKSMGYEGKSSKEAARLAEERLQALRTEIHSLQIQAGHVPLLSQPPK